MLRTTDSWSDSTHWWTFIQESDDDEIDDTEDFDDSDYLDEEEYEDEHEKRFCIWFWKPNKVFGHFHK